MSHITELLCIAFLCFPHYSCPKKARIFSNHSEISDKRLRIVPPINMVLGSNLYNDNKVQSPCFKYSNIQEKKPLTLYIHKPGPGRAVSLGTPRKFWCYSPNMPCWLLEFIRSFSSFVHTKKIKKNTCLAENGTNWEVFCLTCCCFWEGCTQPSKQ